MKRLFVLASIVFFTATGLFAGGYLNLGMDLAFFTNNALFGTGASKVSYFNGSAGMAWDCGLITGLRYDHIDIEDQVVNVENVKFVGAIPSLELGYFVKLPDYKLLWWSTARFGYVASARYRSRVTDYKAAAFVPAVSTSLCYQLSSKFYAGLEVGYRYFNVKYSAIGDSTLNLSGIFAGVSLIHLFN